MIKIYGITVEVASKHFEAERIAYGHKNIPDNAFLDGAVNGGKQWELPDFINLLNFDLIDVESYFFRAFDGDIAIKSE